MNDSKMLMDRRGFLRAGLTSAAALPVAASVFAARSARAEDAVTAVEANKMMVTSLQYVEESAKEGQNCANCQLYTAGEGGRGKCQLFQQGTVAEKGWCMSWAQKV
jgi:hypothetical protein